ncbi:MAG: SDR family NAD(P)-dependent oxidoreductase [Gammaproteobacteria bacterium]|jgi:benzil reductase ((S)-benzoin forming)
MTDNIFVTGNSSGLGFGLTKVYLEQGASVYGLSRRGCELEHQALHDIRVDLNDLDSIPAQLERLLGEVKVLSAVFLNAGVLGQPRLMQDTPVEDLQAIMISNVWSNKVILDWLIRAQIRTDQIVLISSGAAVSGGKGWAGYSISKSALNMLAQLYAHEFPHSHLISLAPGLVDTEMQTYISDPANIDTEQFPGFTRLREARGTNAMPGPDQAARKIKQALPKLKKYQSGSFVDIRALT